MKKILLVLVLIIISHWTYSQGLTLPELKALKNVYQPDIIQVPDSAIVFPVTGIINIDIKNSLMGETVVEVEVWVIDAKGKLVYNNIFAGKDLKVTNFDADYMRYMMMKGKRILKQRHIASASWNEKKSDS